MNENQSAVLQTRILKWQSFFFLSFGMKEIILFNFSNEGSIYQKLVN